MIHAATLVLENGFVSLAATYRSAFPNSSYTAEHARQRLLQLPLMCFLIGHASEGNAQYILMENNPGASHQKLRIMIDGLSSLYTQSMKTPCLDRASMDCLLLLGQSERERTCIKYLVCKASGISCTKARKLYGFDNMSTKNDTVNKAIVDIQSIREAIDNIAAVEDKVLLSNFSIEQESASNMEDDTFIVPSNTEEDTFVQELVPSSTEDDTFVVPSNTEEDTFVQELVPSSTEEDTFVVLNTEEDTFVVPSNTEEDTFVQELVPSSTEEDTFVVPSNTEEDTFVQELVPSNTEEDTFVVPSNTEEDTFVIPSNTEEDTFVQELVPSSTEEDTFVVLNTEEDTFVYYVPTEFGPRKTGITFYRNVG
uniref:Uncharacterized protein n=1 Tax=Amphimedon queenslandica TaxID=400682 RepID=A0A1X7STF2_AMPQE